MKVTNIEINNVNDGLSANSLAPTGPWQENRQYKGSDGISHVVIVGLGDNPAKWDMTKAKYYYAKEDNVNKHPSQHPEVWGEVPYFEYIISASGLFGKISADQIEVSALQRKFVELPKGYKESDIVNAITKRDSYYFLVREGDNIILPYMDEKCIVPEGTEIIYIVYPHTQCYPRDIRVGDDGRGQMIYDSRFNPIEMEKHTGPQIDLNRWYTWWTFPLCSGVVSFMAVRGKDGGCAWMVSNFSELQDITGIEKDVEKLKEEREELKEEREELFTIRIPLIEQSIDNKADKSELDKKADKKTVDQLIDRTRVNSSWEDWSINGNTRIDLRKTSFIQFSNLAEYGSLTNVTLKNGNIGRNVIVETPEWNSKPVKLIVQFENGGQSTYRLPARTQALYYVSFWGDGSKCTVSKIATENIPKE